MNLITAAKVVLFSGITKLFSNKYTIYNSFFYKKKTPHLGMWRLLN